MKRFFVVRHGNTFEPGETSRRIGARTDLPLVASGEEQARALGRWFREKDVAFARVFASSLQRAQDTASLIVADQPRTVAVTIVPWLREIDHGPDENLPEPTVRERLGAAALAAWERSAIVPDGWRVDAATRIAAWQAAFDAQDGGDTLLVTSSGAARFALLALSPTAPLPEMLGLRTGAVGEIVRDDAGALHLARWNVRPES